MASDRTDEFLRTVNLFKGKGAPQAQHRRPDPSAFTVGAKRVSFSLADIEKLIASLNQLVTQKGLFNDPSAKINEITGVFKRDIKSIDSEIEALKRFAAQSQSTTNQRRNHFKIIEDFLQQKLAAQMKEFQQALQKRTTILKEQSSRRGRYGNESGPSAARMMEMQSPLFQPPPLPAKPNSLQLQQQPGTVPQQQPSAEPALPRPGGKRAGTTPPRGRPGVGTLPGNPAAAQPPGMGMSMGMGQTGMRRRPGGPGSGGAANAATGGPRQYPVHPGVQYPNVGMGDSGGLGSGFGYGGGGGGQRSQATMERGRDEVKQVEGQIAELGSMFTKMVDMISVQGEMVNRIDDDMDSTVLNVNEGQNELLKYFNNMKGDRGLIIKIFIALIFFVVLFVWLM